MFTNTISLATRSPVNQNSGQTGSDLPRRNPPGLMPTNDGSTLPTHGPGHYSEEPLRTPRPSPPPWAAVGAAFAGALLATLIAGWVIADSGDARKQAAWTGQTLADTLALMGSAPLFQQDYLALTVLANRLTAHPTVANMTVYTIDDRSVVAVGRNEPADQTFTAPVMFEDEMIGYVRVDVHAPAALPWSLLLAAAAGAAAFVAGCVLLADRLARRRDDTSDSPTPLEPVAAPTEQHFLLANLYNQISMGVDERAAVLDAATRHAEQVSHLYRGTVYEVPGLGIGIAFANGTTADDDPAADPGTSTDPGETEDDVFDEICAAFVLMQSLALAPWDGLPEPRFRFALHAGNCPAPDGPPSDRPAVAPSWIEADDLDDAGLLSAVAPDEQLAISSRLLSRLRYTDRFDMAPLDHPVLRDAARLDDGGWLITSVHDTWWAQIAAQSERLASLDIS